MGGEIIEFQHYHALRRTRLHRKQAARGPGGPAQLERRIAYIADLLVELGDLAGGAPDMPSALLVRARASIEKTCGFLKPRTQFVGGLLPEEDDEVDPQPDVDHEILERMYRYLNRPG